jgi:hypothetical protein
MKVIGQFHDIITSSSTHPLLRWPSRPQRRSGSSRGGRYCSCRESNPIAQLVTADPDNQHFGFTRILVTRKIGDDDDDDNNNNNNRHMCV